MKQPPECSPFQIAYHINVRLNNVGFTEGEFPIIIEYPFRAIRQRPKTEWIYCVNGIIGDISVEVWSLTQLGVSKRIAG